MTVCLYTCAHTCPYARSVHTSMCVSLSVALHMSAHLCMPMSPCLCPSVYIASAHYRIISTHAFACLHACLYAYAYIRLRVHPLHVYTAIQTQVLSLPRHTAILPRGATSCVAILHTWPCCTRGATLHGWPYCTGPDTSAEFAPSYGSSFASAAQALRVHAPSHMSVHTSIRASIHMSVHTPMAPFMVVSWSCMPTSVCMLMHMSVHLSCPLATHV